MRQAGSETALEQAWLLVELRDRFALAIEELARRFSRSPSWVSRRLALAAALPAEVQEHVRRGAIVAHGAMRYLVPLARANRGDCVRLAGAIARAHLTTRQLATLYTAYQAASERDVRERLLSDPILYLASVAEISVARAGERKTDAAPGAAALIGADLSILLGVAGRLGRRLKKGRAAMLAPDERTQTGRSFALVRGAVARLEELGPQEWQHAR
jgi:ParB-like chromosome segregation protein Spo0J